MRFFTGARGADMGAEGAGIGAMTAGDADSPLAGGPLAFRGVAAEAPSPTWLAAHPRRDVVYAALEGAGRVAAFARTGEASLVRLGPTRVAGEAVCHIAVAPDASRLVASCWGDGRVVHIPLAADGSLGEPSLAPAAADPYDAALPGAASDPTPLEVRASGLMIAGAADASEPAGDADPEQAGAADPRPSRGHAAAFLPDGRVATTDLGYDLVRIWRVTEAGLAPDHEVVLPYGTGPRHMFAHPSGHLHVVTEFSCEVFTLRRRPDGRWEVAASVATGALPGDTGAELAASHDREVLYAGLRGSDTIQALRVAGSGEELRPVALAESGVTTPRHHVIVRDTLLVAGQGSDEIVSLAIDERTGAPGRVRHRLEHPTPQHVLPVA